ncbi:transposase domain-containing protein [Pseudomonas syringae]
MEVPADLPGVVIFLHGVNDPGASYESVETGLCQGVNERLDRPDLVPGRYGAEYEKLRKLPSENVQDDQKGILDDPDTYLYQRDTKDPKTRSLLIPFYWGYRAEPSEVKRDKNDDPTKLRDQYQDVRGNRLDRHFGKGGGFFANATNNLLQMYDKGLDKTLLHKAVQARLPNTLYMGEGPHRRYFVLAATRLAMLVREIRRVAIGRKAWLFSDTPKGATASAQIYSLVETAKLNGQEPYTWLRHVLERLPHAASVEDYEALLPWNCSPEMPR